MVVNILRNNSQITKPLQGNGATPHRQRAQMIKNTGHNQIYTFTKTWTQQEDTQTQTHSNYITQTHSIAKHCTDS